MQKTKKNWYFGDANIEYCSITKTHNYHLSMDEVVRLRDGLNEAIAVKRQYERWQRRKAKNKEPSESTAHIVDNVDTVLLTYHTDNNQMTILGKDKSKNINLLPEIRLSNHKIKK